MVHVKLLARETANAGSTILDLVALHQMCSQALFCMRPHLFQYSTGIAIMEVVRPPAKGGVHAPDNILQRYRCALPCGPLRYTLFDFRKRVRCRADMPITFARLPALAHPDCKPQEIETFLSGINNAGLALVKREVKTIQHLSYRCQRRFYFASAQHHEVVRIADDVCLQFSAQLMFVPDPIK